MQNIITEDKMNIIKLQELKNQNKPYVGYISSLIKLPDAEKNYNPDPAYLRRLLKKCNITQAQAAKMLGISSRTLQSYLSAQDAAHHFDAPYTVQYALECIALVCPD